MSDVYRPGDFSPERGLLNVVTGLALSKGLWYFHQPDSRRSSRGLPDLIIAGWHGVLFRELKAVTGQLSHGQAVFGYRFKAAGLDWDVWRPADLESGRIERELAAIV